MSKELNDKDKKRAENLRANLLRRKSAQKAVHTEVAKVCKDKSEK